MRCDLDRPSGFSLRVLSAFASCGVLLLLFVVREGLFGAARSWASFSLGRHLRTRALLFHADSLSFSEVESSPREVIVVM